MRARLETWGLAAVAIGASNLIWALLDYRPNVVGSLAIWGSGVVLLFFAASRDRDV